MYDPQLYGYWLVWSKTEEILSHVIHSGRNIDVCDPQLYGKLSVWSIAKEISVWFTAEDTDQCDPQLNKYWHVWSTAEEILILVIHSWRDK